MATRTPSRRGAQSPAGVGLAVSTLEPGQQGYAVDALWYRLLRQRWSCLALVSPDSSKEKTLDVAKSLAQMGARHGRKVTAIDALEVDLVSVARITNQVAPIGGTASDSEERFVIAVESPLMNPLAIGVLAACDAVVLMLQLGITSIPQTLRTIEIIGRDQLVGAVLVRD